MLMQTMMRESWTDERLDDLNAKVDDGFRNVDVRFEHVDRRFDEVDRRFEQVDQRFDRVEGEIRDLRKEVNLRFDALNRALLTSALGLVAVVIASRAIPF
jgi:hypothetical protein